MPFLLRIPLQVGYAANLAGEANFTAVVNVSRKTKPLTVNAKATGYSMSAQLFCENSQGGKVELSNLGLNAINLGEVSLFLNYFKPLQFLLGITSTLPIRT